MLPPFLHLTRGLQETLYGAIILRYKYLVNKNKTGDNIIFQLNHAKKTNKKAWMSQRNNPEYS